MPNPPEPDHGATPKRGNPAGGRSARRGDENTAERPMVFHDPVYQDPETETVVISTPEDDDPATTIEPQQEERRFTAPGFDAKETAVITTPPEQPTEVIPTQGDPRSQGTGTPPPPPKITRKAAPKSAVPQSIPPRDGGRLQNVKRINWGWVLALVVIILAVAAIAILGTVWLTRSKHQKASPEDQVRHTIQNFDVAVQRGDLMTLRGITCGATRDGYVDFDEHAWDETYHRVSAAKQYPVIASIDQVVVNGQHAEANITTFMAYDPQLRSTRSLDLQFRDEQWKVCQSSSS
jgi:hypothetical protein